METRQVAAAFPHQKRGTPQRGLVLERGVSRRRASLRRAGFFAATLMIVGSCGGSPTRPGQVDAPPPPPPPSPAPTALVVSGIVRYVTGRVCEGCTVEVRDGASAGASVLTDASGRYSLSIPFPDSGSITLQASQNGYLPATQTTRGGFASFTLESSHPLDLAGTYAMTIEAGAQCTELPVAIRKREYVVTLTGHPERPRSVFVAHPVDGAFDVFGMTWRVSDQEVMTIAARGDGGEIPGIVERLGSSETIRLAVFSTAQQVTAVTSMRIPVIGGFEHCSGNSACSSCWSQPHLLTMTRR